MEWKINQRRTQVLGSPFLPIQEEHEINGSPLIFLKKDLPVIGTNFSKIQIPISTFGSPIFKYSEVLTLYSRLSSRFSKEYLCFGDLKIPLILNTEVSGKKDLKRILWEILEE